MSLNNKGKSIGYAIGKANWYLKTYISQLLRDGGFDITSEQWLVLKEIAANPGLSQTELAQKCMKDKTNITRIIDQLEKKSYVERNRDDSDRRMYRIVITATGKAVIERVMPLTKSADEICKEGIEESKVEMLIDLLDAVSESIKKKV